jgi:hypothetical protein
VVAHGTDDPSLRLDLRSSRRVACLPCSRNWGPLPSGLVGLIVVILLIFLMLDKFRF